MKTPRELLLNQHRHVEPRLDDLRCDVVQSIAGTCVLFMLLPNSFIDSFCTTPVDRRFAAYRARILLA